MINKCKAFNQVLFLQKTAAGLNQKYSFVDLFKNKLMRPVILKMMFCW